MTKVLYPVLPLRDLVIFPKMIAPLFVGRERSVNALLEAEKDEEKFLVLLTQKDQKKEIPKAGDLFRIGVLAKISNNAPIKEGVRKILVEGIRRVKVVRFVEGAGCLNAEVEPMEEYIKASQEELKTMRASIEMEFTKYSKLNKKINDGMLEIVFAISDIPTFADVVAAHLILSTEKKRSLLKINEIGQKLEKILNLIHAEIKLLELQKRIKERVASQMEKNQKDYYLHEQIRAINKELTDGDKDEFYEMENKIKAKKLSKEAKQKAEGELRKLRSMNPMSSEATVVRNYLECLLNLPWGTMSKYKNNIQGAQEILDNDHYGLNEVKERIIEYIAVKMRKNDNSKKGNNKSSQSPIICLSGPPGVGKTSFSKSIAKALNTEWAKISLGGVHDEAEIKGHRRTYIGALPGMIIQSLRNTKIDNPVILLDEVDKIGRDYKGDPSAALLSALDIGQNNEFVDHYLDVKYDISKVVFILTANNPYNMSKPLLDRAEVITISGYTEDEKCNIATNHIIPKQIVDHGLKDGEIVIHDGVVSSIIRHYTKEAGVRELERQIAKIMRKSLKKILFRETEKVEITNENLISFLGMKKYRTSEKMGKDAVGVVNGLAYTEYGGALLQVEVVLMKTAKKDISIKMTGSLGDVIKESVHAALSWVMVNAATLGISQNNFEDVEMHVHFPEGATPKDGPSAGIALCMAMISAFSKTSTCHDVGMTGEINLRGMVTAIGGLREKLLAARMNGIKTVIIPKENAQDLAEIPENVKSELKIEMVSNIYEAIPIALRNASDQDNIDSISTFPIKESIMPQYLKNTLG